MRIVIIGQGAFGAKTLEALLEKNETVVAAYTPPDAPGGPTDPLKEAATAKGIPVYEPQGYKEEKVGKILASEYADMASIQVGYYLGKRK